MRKEEITNNLFILLLLLQLTHSKTKQKKAQRENEGKSCSSNPLIVNGQPDGSG
jgi:hypothetical protein